MVMRSAFWGNGRRAMGRTAFVAATALGLIFHSSTGFAVDKFVISIGSAGTICDFDAQCNTVTGLCAPDGTTPCASDADCPGCLTVQNEDLIMCTPVSPPVENNTQCRWSPFFDGSATGLNTAIYAADVLPNGDLVMRVYADTSVPDISNLKRKDLALFRPTDGMGNPTPFQLPYTQGQWSLFLDGDAVKDSSDARAWDALEVLFPDSCRDLDSDETIEPQECDVLLSLPAGAALGGIAFKDEDILRCRPTLSPGGTISACEYALFLDSSQINEPYPGGDPGSETDSFQGNLHAFELTEFDKESLSGTMIFRTADQSTLPAHQGDRDLLKMVGSFGPSGACSVTTATRCLTAGDCPDGETCGAFDTNPSTSTATVFLFDGDAPGARVVPDLSAGLGLETIQALAIVPDGDGDGVPDGIDNCPDIYNPGQEDDDGDGIGDVCDQCFGRPDPECRCGDGIIDLPNEACDLGDEFNGAEGSPCSADCHIIGTCTQTEGPCETAEDCPNYPAEGCCGNAVQEGDEACDDGNPIPDDECSNSCQLVPDPVIVFGCEGLVGPSIVPSFGKISKFIDTKKVTDPGFDRWGIRGEFIIAEGIPFDPDSQTAKVIFSQDGIIYQATVPISTFEQKGSATRPMWKFSLAGKDPDIPGAEGWRKGKFNVKGGRGLGPVNRLGYGLVGKLQTWAFEIDPSFLGGPPARLRQTIRVGNLCATIVVTCEEKASGKMLKCSSQQF